MLISLGFLKVNLTAWIWLCSELVNAGLRHLVDNRENLRLSTHTNKHMYAHTKKHIHIYNVEITIVTYLAGLCKSERYHLIQQKSTI